MTSNICNSDAISIANISNKLTRAEEFGQNYVRSAATSVDKLENSRNFLTQFCVECVEFEDKNSTHSTQTYVRNGGEFSNLSTLFAADLTC